MNKISLQTNGSKAQCNQEISCKFSAVKFGLVFLSLNIFDFCMLKTKSISQQIQTKLPFNPKTVKLNEFERLSVFCSMLQSKVMYKWYW